MNCRISFALTSGLLVLTGCVPFTGKPLSPEDVAKSFDSRTLHAPELKTALKAEGITMGSRWSLTRFVAAASHLNPDLAVLRARMQTAEAELQTASERPNPMLSFKPAYNSSSSGISPWIIEPGLEITIETGGKRDARMAAAAAKVRTARLDLAAGIWKTRGEVRRALLAMHAAEATRGRYRYRSQETLQAEEAILLETQLKDGAATPQDLVAARVPLSQTRLLMQDTEMLAAKAQGQLAAAVGVPVSALAGLDLDFSEVTRLPSAPTGGAARRHALTHRADILAALSDYAASEESLRLEVAKQYPDVKLGPGYKLDQTDHKWTLGVGFEIPILHRHQGAIAEAESRRAEAAARFMAVQARAIAEIDLALSVYRAARSRAAAAGVLASDVKVQTDAAEAMHADGEISRLEVTRRKVAQGAADLTREQVRIQAFEAVGALEDALQTPHSLWK